MKNLIFGLIATVFMINLSWGQLSKDEIIQPPTTIPTNKAQLACYTLSCCGVGPFGIEIWTHRVCHYVTVTHRNISEEFVDLYFNKNISDKQIVVSYDVLIPSKTGNSFVTLPKGTYDVINNNMISFKPLVNSNKGMYTVCYERTFTGSFLGHNYSNTYTVCISYWDFSFKSNNYSSLIEIDLKLSSKQLENINESADFVLNEDVNIKDEAKGINFTIKKGTYKVNSNGKFYLNNQNLIK